jgi:hypothetical protein
MRDSLPRLQDNLIDSARRTPEIEPVPFIDSRDAIGTCGKFRRGVSGEARLECYCCQLGRAIQEFDFAIGNHIPRSNGIELKATRVTALVAKIRRTASVSLAVTVEAYKLFMA